MPSEDSKPVKKEELQDEDEDDKCLSSIMRDKSKKKPASLSGTSSKLPKPKEETPDAKANSSSHKKAVPKPAKVMKLESETFDSDDDKPIAKKPVPKDTKPVAKKPAANDDKPKIKTKMKEEVKKTIQVEVKKKERKVYDLPGQKRDPPEERDPLRIFYESLYEQRPDSEMAAFWMMESGLLPEDVAKEVYEKKQKKSQMQRFGSPMKVESSTKRVVHTKSVTVKKANGSSVSASKRNTTTTVTTVKTNKRKKDEASSEEDSEDDFVISNVVKKRKT